MGRTANRFTRHGSWNWNLDLISPEDTVLNERLRRVTDLFIEGTDLYFGLDDDGKPIVMWVNKLNSFEAEEARRDAMSKRGLRIAELSKEDSPELAALMASLNGWSDEKLAQRRVDQMSEELYLKVINDIESEDGWREKVDLIRRGTTLLDDEGVPDDDPRRKELSEVQLEYINKVRTGQEAAQLDALAEMKGTPRSTMIEDYLENWRNRESLDVFMQERRVSEIYATLRDCKGKFLTGVHGNDGAPRFDHGECSHSQRMLVNRSEVYQLPEAVIERVGDAIDGITVPMREAGNSDAPASSSASSEQSSAEEEVSTPSTPIEMPLAVPTT